MINLRRKHLDCTSKTTVLSSLLLLAVLSWASFWFYTHVTVATTERAVSGQFQELLLYRFDTALNSINSRAATIERRAGILARQLEEDAGHTRTATLETLLEHTLQGTRDLAGVAVFRDWPSEQASMALYKNGQQTLFASRAFAPDWLQQLPESFAKPMTAGDLWWTPVYRHPVTDESVITLVKPVLSDGGRLTGLVSMDWKIRNILVLAAEAETTSGTLVWLTDSNHRQFAPAYRDRRNNYVQEVMEKALGLTPMTVFLTGFERQALNVPERPTELYYAPSRSGLQLSVAIPRADMAAPVEPLQAQSKQYLLYLAAVILLLTLFGLGRLIPALRDLRASYIDKLTGLPNRPRLMQDLDRDSRITLILINLDRFREVNSLFGDDCGDLILKEVALRLESFMSGAENGHGRLYRVGGDEFAITLPRRRPELVQEQLEQILKGIRRSPIYWQNHEVGMSATLGAAVPWFNTPKEHSLYIHAREALREAREKGLHYRVYDGTEPLEQEFEHNQKWAGKLRDALDTEGLVAWFQPILNNTTGLIDKYECLVRMLDQNGEVVSPGKFLGVAGKMRLEGHITRVMVDTCFKRFADSPMQFSINLSYTDLQRTELTEFILQRLDATGVGPRVIFELLESANIDNYEQVRAFVDEVKKRGCRIAIDDFGTGYSNFEHLLQLKVDFIKIDGSLIRNLDRDPNSRRVARGIVGLARSMKIETVAEYVHSTAVQMEVLRLGISFSQGELIGMPAPEPLMQTSKEFARLSYSGRNQAKSAVRV